MLGLAKLRVDLYAAGLQELSWKLAAGKDEDVVVGDLSRFALIVPDDHAVGSDLPQVRGPENVDLPLLNSLLDTFQVARL